MTPHVKERPQAGAYRGRMGFTMVELLVVLMVLSILVALVVGIGNNLIDGEHRTQTRAWQKLIMEAVGRYVQINDAVPPVMNAVWENTPADGFANNEMWRCRTLYTYLAREAACFDIIKNLPASAFGTGIPITYGGGSGAQFPGDDGWGGEFYDSYGKVMDWYPSGGTANTPVLISAGADTKYGHKPGTEAEEREFTGPATVPNYTEEQLDEQEDNIRYDGRTMAT